MLKHVVKVKFVCFFSQSLFLSIYLVFHFFPKNVISRHELRLRPMYSQANAKLRTLLSFLLLKVCSTFYDFILSIKKYCQLSGSSPKLCDALYLVFVCVLYATFYFTLFCLLNSVSHFFIIILSQKSSILLDWFIYITVVVTLLQYSNSVSRFF